MLLMSRFGPGTSAFIQATYTEGFHKKGKGREEERKGRGRKERAKEAKERTGTIHWSDPRCFHNLLL